MNATLQQKYEAIFQHLKKESKIQLQMKNDDRSIKNQEDLIIQTTEVTNQTLF